MAYDCKLWYFEFQQQQIPLSNTIAEDGDFPRLNLFPVMLDKQIVLTNDLVRLYAVELPVGGIYEWDESSYTALFENIGDPKVRALIAGFMGNTGFVLNRVREQTGDNPSFGSVPGFNATEKLLIDNENEPVPGDDTEIKTWASQVIFDQWDY